MNEILTTKKNVLGEKEQELSRVKMELDSKNLEYNRLQIAHKYAVDDLKIKEDEVNKLTEQNQTLSNELLNGKLTRMELEHETKSSKGKFSELNNEIETYKKELDDLKNKCTYLSSEVQSTHRQMTETKSDMVEKDRILANKDIKIAQ